MMQAKTRPRVGGGLGPTDGFGVSLTIALLYSPAISFTIITMDGVLLPFICTCITTFKRLDIFTPLQIIPVI